MLTFWTKRRLESKDLDWLALPPSLVTTALSCCRHIFIDGYFGFNEDLGQKKQGASRACKRGSTTRLDLGMRRAVSQ